MRRSAALAAAVALALATTWGTATPAAAHRDGCHRWHSCPSDTGSYVCGDTGHFNECGYTSLPGSGSDSGSGSGSGSGNSEPYDLDPPATPTVKDPAAGPGGRVTLTVTAERGSRIEVHDTSGDVVAKATATGSAQRIAFTAADGEHSYSVVAVDRADNTSEATPEFTLSTDAAKPAAEALTAAPVDATTAAVSVSFTAEPGASYELAAEGRGGKVAGTVEAGGSVRQELWLPDGTHRITATVRDAAGNTTVLTTQATVGLAAFQPRIGHDPAYRTRTPALRITGPRGAKGTLSVAGTRHGIALDTYGQATVPLTLSDGSYTAELALTDPFGRRGEARSTGFTVDTRPPALTLGYDGDRARYGEAVLLLEGEKGAAAVITSPGGTPRRTTLTGARQTVALRLPQGTHTITVTATDAVGNATRRTVGLRLSDEWTAGEIWRALLWWLGVIAALAVAGLLLWRRRRPLIVWWARRREAVRVAAERRAAHAREQAGRRARETYETDLAGWRRERDRLAGLRDLAENPPAVEYAGADFRWGRRKAGEKVHLVTTATLVEVRTRQGVSHTERTEAGEIAVTDQRVLFLGPAKRREWDYGRWLGHDHDARASQTLIMVSNRQKTSGVAYPAADADRIRLVIDLALARSRGERSGLAEAARRRLTEHERLRPVAPVGV
ncbi:hypothetical protein ACFYU9_33130 [Streptomyces sp. NPDC004327]|uniref:hypothetical protein n=1 Tax=unclassified Streptomyces TaxID=2593676 RepID=UPI00367B2941